MLTGKILTIKVRGRLGQAIPDQERQIVGFHGVTPQSTKRIKAGEVFEILATPYKKQDTHMRGTHDTDKRVEHKGDPREQICLFMRANRGWTEKMCGDYLKYQFYDPESMDVLEDQSQPSNALPDDYLLKLNESEALKAAVQDLAPGTLEQWLAAEKGAGKPRPKVIAILSTLLGIDPNAPDKTDLTTQSPNYLDGLDEKGAVKAIRKQDDPKILNSWLENENGSKNRQKVIAALREALDV